ncbi:MAG TPA: FtsX-like permease family protein [Lacipirellulaceae bacterium]|nr:FtsX-like permease family protein [Lacipirellulaceae bacterium]
MISALDRKLLRDLSQMKGQSIAIAIVIAAGVATFVNSRTILYSLELTRSTFYERYRFADVFARVKRAPDTVTESLTEIPGVSQVETRIVELVTLDVPGLEDPAVGQLISLPVTRQPRLNQLYLRRGRQLELGRDDEVLASEAFMKANNLDLGSTIVAIVNGRRKELRIVGVAFSPEYVFQIKPGDMLPDPKHFGILWMEQEALSTAYDMKGGFNDVSIGLTRGTSVDDVIRRVDTLLEPYGCLGAFPRKDQLSNLLLQSDIQGLRSAGLIAPTIFLCVAAFLLNVVMTRLTGLQREQIAALKAFGYTNLQIGWHYMKYVLVITIIGGLIGTLGGMWLAHDFTKLFLRVYQYPELVFRVRPNVVVNAVLVAGGASLAGAFGAIALAVRLPPAEAMRPEPPARYRPTYLERIGLGRFVPNVARMVLRQLERHPVKTTFSFLAISMSVAIIVVGNFMRNSVDEVIQTQFYDVQRYDLSLATVEPVSIDAVQELANLAGVERCEPRRFVAVRLRAANHSRRVGIVGLPPDASLMRLKTRTGHFVDLPREGLVISKKLAQVLGVNAGETIHVEALQDKRPAGDVRIVSLLDDISGLNAYMDIDALNRFMHEGQLISGAMLTADPKYIPAIYRHLKETPHVASVTIRQASVDSFRNTVAKNMLHMRMINLTFAIIIALGVVYNGARISLSERSRELATLRVIGFTRREISTILLGEIGTVTLVGIPFGLVMGYWFAWILTLFLDQEVFRFPFVIANSTYGLAAATVLAASIGSALLVRRKLDDLDLIAVLKAKE